MTPAPLSVTASMMMAPSVHRSSIAAIVLVDGCVSAQTLSGVDGEAGAGSSGNPTINDKLGGGGDKDPFGLDYDYDDAGGANSFDAFTAAYGSSCLVPVGNKSLIWYSLRRLECAGFKTVYVAVQGEHHARTVASWVNEKTKHKVTVWWNSLGSPQKKMGNASANSNEKHTSGTDGNVNSNNINSNNSNNLGADIGRTDGDSSSNGANGDCNSNCMNIEVVPVNENVGTADALREIINKKKLIVGRGESVQSSENAEYAIKEYLVVHAGLIHDVNLQIVAAAHRFNSALTTVVLSPKIKGSAGVDGTGGAKMMKRKDYLEKTSGDMVGLKKDTSELVYFSPEDDWKKAREISLRKGLVRMCERLTLRTDMTDVGLYFFSRKAMEILDETPEIHSIRDHLLPVIARKQFLLQLNCNNSERNYLSGTEGMNKSHSNSILNMDPSGQYGYVPSTPVSRGSISGQSPGLSQFDCSEGKEVQCFVYNADSSYCFQVRIILNQIKSNNDFAIFVTCILHIALQSY